MTPFEHDRKLKSYEVLVEFQPATYVHVMAESEEEAVNRVNKLVDDRCLDFDGDGIRDDLLENVVKISCGDAVIDGQSEKVTKSTDPFRFSIRNECSGDETELLDANAREFAHSVVDYPTETSWVRAKKVTDDLGDRFIIYGQFHNDRGHTEHVDDCLERFTMRHWREIAVAITELLLKRAGLLDARIALTEWPTPEIAVTKTADVNDNDCVDLVKFEWATSEEVARQVLEHNHPHGAEEVCPHCDTVVKFNPTPGKAILICPTCGRAICACTLCDHGHCNGCSAEKICDRIYNAKEVKK